MDFSLTDEQELLLGSLRELLAREATPEYVARCDAEHRQPVSLKKAMADAGFLSLGFPEEYGGTPVEKTTLCLLVEEVAKAGLNVAYGIELLQAKDIMDFGNEEHKRHVLGRLAEGQSPFALCITEPGAGSDNGAMATTAEDKDSQVVINGTKTLITNAREVSDLLVLAVNPEIEDKRHNVSMYLVPVNTPGISMSPIEKISWHTNTSDEIYFDSVTVGPDALVGTKGNGFLQLMKNFEIERLMMGAIMLGLAEAAFSDAAGYAAQRVQFGHPIGSYQLIQEKLTDMSIKIENMRGLIFKTAWLMDQGLPVKTMGAMTKRYCGLAANEVADDAVQIFGGIGITEGTRVSRIWRDLRGHRLGGGTDEIMVHIVGREIIKEHSPK
jgi:alkylation response protein AidB-like acyl-CoA dehydrogenase